MTTFSWEGAGCVEEALNRKVGRMPGVRKEVRGEADKRAAVAKGVLAANKKSGDAYVERIDGKVDAFIYLVDERGQSAAAAIEYGRREFVRESTRKDGRVYKHIFPATKGVGALDKALGR